MDNRSVIIYGEELYHHGIKGQKWGERNGPPYPLDPNDHSALERKKGWRTSLSSSSKEYKKGLNRATIYGGVIGRAIYKNKNKEAGAEYNKEKTEMKNTKKMMKIDKYRNKLAIRDRKRSEKYSEYAREDSKHASNLKKEGANSEEFKKFKRDNAWYSTNGSLGGIVVAGLMTAGQNAYYNKHSQKYVDALVKEYSDSAKEWREISKGRNTRYERLMNMDINEFTSKKDVKKARRGY